jgi:hypothetical protein
MVLIRLEKELLYANVVPLPRPSRMARFCVSSRRCSAMRLDPSLPWDVLFDRVLQSWKDSAYGQSRSPFLVDDVICDACFWDRYVSLGMACDEFTDHEWPHWMRHTLRDLLIELRCVLFDHLVARPYAGETVGDYYRGSGHIPKSRQGREVRGANEIVNDHGTVVDLWLKQRMATLGRWPERVRRAALHEKSRS